MSRLRRSGKERDQGSLWRPSSGRWLILAGCCTVLWALFPSTGQAAPEGDATLQIGVFTVQPGQFGAGQAFCPAGTRVTGGGITSTDPPGGDLQVSGPLDETGLTSFLNDGDVGKSWYARIFNGNGTPNTYAVTAICSQASDATFRNKSITLNDDQYGAAQPSCPSGSRVIGGGATNTNGQLAEAVVGGPLDETGLTANLADGDVGRSWFTYLLNGGPNPSTFVATAICSPGSDATIRTDAFTVTPGAGGDGQAFCPPDTRVVGGGVTTTGPATGYVEVSGPLDDSGLTANLNNGDVGRSWYAAASNAGPDTNTYVATAVCAPPASTTPKVTCKGKTATIYAGRVSARPLKGTSNDDVIVGTSGRDKINAGKGNDLVCAGDGNDKVKGGPGKDKLFGQGGRDKLLGGGGNDACVGGPGRDKEKSC
jgi:Ca2+-binding RTX toxin-like protein